MYALLVLEDGRTFEGTAFGARGEKFGEVVFNTSLTGYQEILTDPSYRGQIVTMTYPLIGNYGVNPEDVESSAPHLAGFSVRETSKIASNWRATQTLDSYLRKNGIVGIEGIDTRALTRHIRLEGAMRAVLSTRNTDCGSLVEKARRSPGLIGRDLVREVTCPGRYTWSRKGRRHVVVIDCGVKYNILRSLSKRGLKVTVIPYDTPADQILAFKSDGVLVSNGPGDPAAVKCVINTLKALIGRIPVFGICLGHQLLCLALGGQTYKLKFGHHGGNHPVKDLRTGRIYITAQNHGFCVDMDTVDSKDVEITHMNLNDNTCEGMRHKRLPVFSVQFHPEAGPGPRESAYLFDEFADYMNRRKCYGVKGAHISNAQKK
ncbi:MAG: glutamine-hydrolyzing carbamoyl-phosphate synthase small subunit [Candidatus Omnitrophota bacterium]